MRITLNIATLSFALLAASCGNDLSAGNDAGTSADDDEEPDEDGLDGGESATFPDGASTTPVPSPIRYVLVLVKENHTFDNYFTGFPGAESSKTAMLSTGKTLTRPAAPTGPLPRDICHANSCGQKAYRNGT